MDVITSNIVEIMGLEECKNCVENNPQLWEDTMKALSAKKN